MDNNTAIITALAILAIMYLLKKMYELDVKRLDLERYKISL